MKFILPPVTLSLTTLSSLTLSTRGRMRALSEACRIPFLKFWMDCDKLMLNDKGTESLLLKSDRTKIPDPASAYVRIGKIDHSFCYPCKKSWFHNLLQKQPWTRMPQTLAGVQVCWTAARKLHQPPSDSRSNQNSCGYLHCLKARPSQLSPFLLPQYLLDKLQKVKKIARLVQKSRKHDNVQPLLFSLHWLPINLRIYHKTSTLCFSTFSDTSPVYLFQLLSVIYMPFRQLRSSSDALFP